MYRASGKRLVLLRPQGQGNRLWSRRSVAPDCGYDTLLLEVNGPKSRPATWPGMAGYRMPASGTGRIRTAISCESANTARPMRWEGGPPLKML